MTKVDLITGFLGSGKTTFIRKYAEYLMKQGLNIGIIENDFGAVNVDMMLLSDLESDNCTIEMVAGGCDKDCHARRFKTKLIALGMQGLDRVIIEPSGIYDTYEFFEVLHEEPLDRWYTIGSVITIADICQEETISDAAKYMMASQLSCCGCVLASKLEKDCTDISTICGFKDVLNRALCACNCNRVLDDEVLAKPWSELDDSDFARLMNCGYQTFSVSKESFVPEDAFQTLYYMNNSISVEQLMNAANRLFRDSSFGKIIRIKGFIRNENGGWIEVNATRNEFKMTDIVDGQDVIIVIGEHLDEAKINTIF